MIKLKKVAILLIIFLLSACAEKLPSDVVISYLDNYVNLNKEVINNIDKIVNNTKEFNDEYKKIYKEIFYRQYKDLKYQIIDEETDNNKAIVRMNINVYNLYKSEEKALDYITENIEEFYNEDKKIDNNKCILKKLEYMREEKERVDYEIVFYLTKNKGSWIVKELTDEDLKKIHGIYEYDLKNKNN